MRQICGIEPDDLISDVVDAGYSETHVSALLTQFYRRRNFSVCNINSLPKGFRDLISSRYEPGIPSVLDKRISSDGTVKYLFETDRAKLFESVFIPDGKRKTVCISSQSGCRMGCPFCATSKVGFRGNLTAGEMVGQILAADDSSLVTNVVFMGMGEPMDNIENVIKASKILTSSWGLSLGKTDVTVSTVGIIYGIRKYLKETESNLTLSLFSPFADERLKIVPAQAANPVNEIINILKDHAGKGRRRISIAYVMVRGVNDADRHLEELINIFSGTGINVNLIPYHKHVYNDYLSAEPERIEYFRHSLMTSGVITSVRRSRGGDINAACGLLAARAISSH